MDDPQALILLTAIAAIITVPILLIVRAARAAQKRNEQFLASAVTAAEVAPGVAVDLAFPPAPCELWLQLDVRGNDPITFVTDIAFDGQYGSHHVTIDDEGDIRGLPQRYGIVARNTRMKSFGSSLNYSGAIWIASIQHGSNARVALTPNASTTIDRARVLVCPA